MKRVLLFLLPSLAWACTSDPEGLARSQPADTTVKFDFFHRPLPEIPLPNDLATRFDETSATLRRPNVSVEAPTSMERLVRRRVDTLDGWGVMQAITIPFTGLLDLPQIQQAHGQDDYDTRDDLIYLINIDRKSPGFGRLTHLDIGKKNHPPLLENLNNYWPNDPRGFTISTMWEEAEEDLNGNGVLDPGEDTDLDGLLDHPNYLPGMNPARDDMPGRADALMTFYERATNTLVARPMDPLLERTTYAVVVTRRLRDAAGKPVGSPFEWVHHLAQRDALAALPEVLPPGVALEDVAFAFSYTTQSIEAPWKAVRDGLYGFGVQADISRSFVAEVTSLKPLRDPSAFPGMTNPYIVHAETVKPLIREVQIKFQNTKADSLFLEKVLEGLDYVDYFAIGKMQLPQLFPERDADGKLLPMNDRVWPADLDRVPAPVRLEDVYFTLVVPRKEVSPRGEGRPADVVLLGHGYGGNRFDAINMGGFMARHGLATLAIDGPGHGLQVDPLLKGVVEGVFEDFGLSPMAAALLSDRVKDVNGDQKTDPGEDFWTSYLFHTRDVVRQYVLDYMSTVKVLRTFDGTTTWRLDVNNDGVNELAGDFDGDGAPDVGGSGKIVMTGGSLGGIISVLLGSLEPAITSVAPVAAGGTLSNIGVRSTVGGVRVAMMLRSMGPLFLGTRDPATGRTALSTIIPDVNQRGAELPLGEVEGLAIGDAMAVENLNNGEVRCGVIDAEGRTRVGLPSDLGDSVRIRFFSRDQVTGGDRCLTSGTAKVEITTFGEEIEFQTRVYPAGSTLVTLAEGLGLRRGNPELRRFQGIGQLVLDAADPAVFAKHLSRDRMSYPGTGEQTGSHMLLVTTTGDSSVPVDSGMVIARTAGLLPYLENDPRYGKPANQVLLDWHMAESSETYRRYLDRSGTPVHPDVEGFDQHTAPWDPDITHLDPPLRLGFDRTDPLGGKSAAIFPLTAPEGDHGFDLPWRSIERVYNRCMEACMANGTPCDCARDQGYDVGNFLLSMTGRFLRTDGQSLPTDLCLSTDSCADELIAPVPRDPDVLR